METVKKGRYKHFKGKDYEVLDVALHSETQEPHVIYRALYGDQGLWLRPLSMFTETIERDGKSVPRFAYLGDSKTGGDFLEICREEGADPNSRPVSE